MMKKSLLLLGSCLLTAACSTTQVSTPAPKEVKTAGQLICSPTELCPSLLVKWNENQKNQLRVDVHLSSSYNFYDINALTFDIDGKRFNYEPAQATEKTNVSRLVPKHSTTYFVIPSQFLQEFKNAQNVNVLIKTDKGTIERNMYSPQKQSSVYKNFMQLYQNSK
ncbi:hypothetical protein [Acinetobacter pittii]|uniref:hypothetical protein n=1 Tax=Acinetobacter pittii TaxID=48296 RepID=UPI00069A77AA|nr:hypothetical protein [Acinetobacter pittii]TDM65112.1 hypothetical protein C5B72_05035 [Acinetobacter sp. KU 011TH]TDM65600.1 hypothetical protein C4608_05035 [Acinetobacter sp. KU 013TH]TGU86250.1 hypothetical protein YA64_013230 [Acinetobacter pittii]